MTDTESRLNPSKPVVTEPLQTALVPASQSPLATSKQDVQGGRKRSLPADEPGASGSVNRNETRPPAKAKRQMPDGMSMFIAKTKKKVCIALHA